MSCGRARTHDHRISSQRLTLSRHTGRQKHQKVIFDVILKIYNIQYKSDNVITQYYMNVEFPQMYTVLMLIFIYIKDMLLLCYPASLIQRNATCSYLKGT